MPPLTLVIDTAGPACSAALLRDGAVVDERHELVGRGHAERLLPLIADLLGRDRPEAILVDCGPGSFTGVRVGLAAAHGLRLGWQVPLAGYSSTALLAAAAGGGEVGVAMIAGHGQLFVQSFADDPLHPTDALRSLPPEEAAAAIGAELVTGSAAGQLVALRGFGRAAPAELRAAEARRLPEALRVLPPRPIYGRAPDAKPAA
ncbi:MAG: tRNA (adenosine(37)-N6)-threonylcarbamoyltransferase complex dimerization subunit type 1 TsaB [Alphaproteobacteria bacterium]|nr:tRNA (adenosine(37)-N6)-threonylcarbamoyltransferase complex dimerization subunit type 1 TsaB [Alphaproteobacteria bacterium]MBV9373179.1 tRNA (adenosine(37)-N6)-threonylcarbamoyltransferase complex dimerization subunit type 1 TsaB [Alphaproteobacteria bacterium]MBV9900268.1 tRNA (adenosine(37)-N6)-threonylcarbamoyltransferase complex dimerization subunit type 1 TsaB [Alphaproteobacteria bacterium]